MTRLSMRGRRGGIAGGVAVRAVAATLVAVTTFSVAGCGASIAELPLPGSYVPGPTYRVNIEFSSVLNLPDRAKVVLDGVDVGLLDSVNLVGTTAVAAVDIDRTVELPAATRAELRQGTILGEIYVSLQRPAPDAPQGGALQDGDTIPLERTDPADNVEDVLRGLSEVVAGGHIVDFQRSIDRFNRAIPPPETVDLINEKARQALTDLATNDDELDRILGAAETVFGSFAARTDTLDTVLTTGPERVGGLADALLVVVDALIDLGYMSRNIGDIINPVYGDLRDVVATLQPMVRTLATADLTAPMLASRMDALLRERLVPFFSSAPNVRVTSVSGPPAPGQAPVDRANEMIAVLRGIGFVR
ncbi:MlaD family protein [Rhodococcoides corynebacterioides]|uniref:MlaD family protein n=1 Tax=Rhodococcoides corynebacterioides TaxID=53972 RepID=UPI001C9A9445|nr:MlaD family protein [Rhodococcus corynebacterioides]MBY6350280.1 MCE family protein [Rhodococcus corynebacterioides]